MNFSTSFPFGSSYFGRSTLPGVFQYERPCFSHPMVPIIMQESCRRPSICDHCHWTSCRCQKQIPRCPFQSNGGGFSPSVPPRTKFSFGFDIDYPSASISWTDRRNRSPYYRNDYSFYDNYYGPACYKQPYQPRLCYIPPPVIPVSVFPEIKPSTPGPSLIPTPPWRPRPTKPVKPTPANCQCPWCAKSLYIPGGRRLFKTPKRLLTPYGRERHQWRLDQKWNLGGNETTRKSKRGLLERKRYKRPLKKECEWPYCPRRQFKRRRPFMTLDKSIKSPSMLSPRSPRDRSPILFLRTP